MAFGEQGRFLIDTTNPEFVTTNGTFNVTNRGARLTASGLAPGGTDVATLQIWVGANPSGGEGAWADVAQGGQLVQLSATNTQMIVVLLGAYRVTYAGASDVKVYVEEDTLDLDGNIMYSTTPGSSSGGGGGGGGGTPAGVDGEFQMKAGTAFAASGVIESDSLVIPGAKEIALPVQTVFTVPTGASNFIFLANGFGDTGSYVSVGTGVAISSQDVGAGISANIQVSAAASRITFSAPEVKFNSPPYAALTELDPGTATASDCATLLNAILAAMKL